MALGVEACNDLARVHSGLDELECDLAADRLLLLGNVDQAEATLANLFLQRVPSDNRPGPLGHGLLRIRAVAAVENAVGLRVGAEQALDAPAQGVVAAARLVQKSLSLHRVHFLNGGIEQRFFVHGDNPQFPPTLSLTAPEYSKTMLCRGESVAMGVGFQTLSASPPPILRSRPPR